MPTVECDDRSFLIDGQRVWLVSGSVHYFRVPKDLWRDRLIKAKRAGLNCIDTYVAWNVHEPREGEWDLEGQADVAEFVRLCGELGLYVILRPGPYICSEWDCGGLPGWLTAKAGVSLRTNNAAYTHYFDKYFRQVLPRLAELQVPRGGPIIAIQNENEYYVTTQPDRLTYLEFISQLFSRAGFEIPIITCNWLTEPFVPGAVECVNTWSHAVRLLKQLRLHQPDKPLLVTEFWAGWFDYWGGEHQRKCPVEAARRAIEITGCGAQYNYYMWHGGTNFDFWGSQLTANSHAWQTTSYDYDAPLAEGGGLTEKYYTTRVANLFAQHMGPWLAECGFDEPGVNSLTATDVLNTVGPHGRWAVVTNNGHEDIASAKISLPTAEVLDVPLEPYGAVAIPSDLRLTTNHTLDRINAMPLGFFNEKVLLVTAPVDWEVQVTINHKTAMAKVPKGDEPGLLEHQGLVIVLIHPELARRTWPMVDDELILFGPDFVGETVEDLVPPARGSQYSALSFEGKLSRRKYKAEQSRPGKPAAVKLGNFSRRCVCTEPVDEELAWEKLDRPRDVDHIGQHYGYVWYRVDIPQDRAKKRNLLVPDLADRATLYLNGELLGLVGRGEGATREPISAPLKKGTNRLIALLDNMGRFSFGPRVGEPKGIFGPVWDAKLLRTRKFKVSAQESFHRRIIPRKLAYLAGELEQLPLHHAELDLPLRKVGPIQLSFSGLNAHVAIVVNERMCSLYPRMRDNFGDLTLNSELKKGTNRIRLMIWGDFDPKQLDNVKFYELQENLSDQAKWFYRPWDVPGEGGALVGKDQPAWYAASFSHDGDPTPLFLHVVGAKKGQLFLNGHNLGRFWTIGPQQDYYLPSCWLAEENELLIFEEHGNTPSRSSLVYRPAGPFRE